MNNFLARWLANAVAIFITTKLVKGIDVDSIGTALVAALLLGVVNAFVRPILLVLSFPLTIMSLGLFVLILNGLMLMLVSSLVRGFDVHGLFAAVVGSVAITICAWLIGAFIGAK